MLWCLLRTGIVFAAETAEFMVRAVTCRGSATVEEAAKLNYARSAR